MVCLSSQCHASQLMTARLVTIQAGTANELINWCLVPTNVRYRGKSDDSSRVFRWNWVVLQKHVTRLYNSPDTCHIIDITCLPKTLKPTRQHIFFRMVFSWGMVLISASQFVQWLEASLHHVLQIGHHHVEILGCAAAAASNPPKENDQTSFPTKKKADSTSIGGEKWWFNVI